jgi:ribonuclease HII
MNLIAGVDEVGRGALAGPVVSCAVILRRDHNIIGLKDSKKLSKKKREELYPLIIKSSAGVGIGEVNHDVIDRINIREATFKSMILALKNLPVTPTYAFIDGERLKDTPVPNEGIVGGDNLVDSIKAASIIAKVTRDKIMRQYSVIFPNYDFENNSGYATQKHLKGLKKYKSSPVHRNTFKPVSLNLASVSFYRKNKLENNLAIQLIALELIKRGYNILKINQNIYFRLHIHIIARKSGIVYFLNIRIRNFHKNILFKDELKSRLISNFKNESEKYKYDNQKIYKYRFKSCLISLFTKETDIKFFDL